MNNNGESSSTGMIVGILVIVVIAIVAWIAYAQGFFSGKEEAKDNTSAVEINLVGGTENTDNTENKY